MVTEEKEEKEVTFESSPHSDQADKLEVFHFIRARLQLYRQRALDAPIPHEPACTYVGWALDVLILTSLVQNPIQIDERDRTIWKTTLELQLFKWTPYLRGDFLKNPSEGAGHGVKCIESINRHHQRKQWHLLTDCNAYSECKWSKKRLY